MGGKAGRGRTFGLVEAAESVERSDALIADLEQQLAIARAEREDAITRLNAAVRGQPQAAAAPPRKRSAARSNGARSTRRRAAKRLTEDQRQELQQRLLDAMKPGETYTGSELMKLCGFRGPEQNFVRNVRKPLLGAGRLKKRQAVKGNQSPRNVRWART